MKRRALLGTLASLAVAGCSSSGPSERVTETTRTTPAPTTDPGTTTSNVATIGVPVGEADCPFDAEYVERVVCYPEHADASFSLTPADDELALPSGETTFTLDNATGDAFSLNFYDWGLHKRVDGRWYYVTPQIIPEPLHTLPAGEFHEWTFTVDNTAVPSNDPSSESNITVAGLGGGEYAFEVSGWFDAGDHDHRLGVGARFSLDGDQLDLTRPDGYSGTGDSGTVVVTPDDASGDPTEAFVVERVGEAGVPPERQIQQYIAEQLARPDLGTDRTLLADALAYFEEGVEVVRIEEATEFDPPFPRDQSHYFEYRDHVYEARVEPIG